VLIELFLPKGPRLNFFIISGLILGFAGVVLIFNHDLSKVIDPSYFWGYAALFVSIISWAGGSIYSKRKKVDVHPLMGAAVQMFIAGLSQITAGAVLGEFPSFGFYNQESVLAFTYLMIFGSLFGYVAYIYAISHLPVAFVTTYAYINPVIAIFLGWLVLNEGLNAVIIAAAIIILSGVYLVQRGTQRQIQLKN